MCSLDCCCLWRGRAARSPGGRRRRHGIKPSSRSVTPSSAASARSRSASARPDRPPPTANLLFEKLPLSGRLADQGGHLWGQTKYHGSAAQYGTAGRHRRNGSGVRTGSQIGMSDHQPSPVGTGRYSVEQPHQSGICNVCPGCQPCGRRSAARNRIGATSRPQVQQASVGRRRPTASSQMGGVMGAPSA